MFYPNTSSAIALTSPGSNSEKRKTFSSANCFPINQLIKKNKSTDLFYIVLMLSRADLTSVKSA